MPKGVVTKLINLEVLPSPPQFHQPTTLSQLRYAEPTELYLRDGEVVIFRRPNSPLWQCRFKRQIQVAQPCTPKLSYVFQPEKHAQRNRSACPFLSKHLYL